MREAGIKKVMAVVADGGGCGWICHEVVCLMLFMERNLLVLDFSVKENSKFGGEKIFHSARFLLLLCV